MKKNLSWGQASDALESGEATIAKRPTFENNACIKFQRGKYPIDGPARETINGLPNTLFDFSEEQTPTVGPSFRMCVGVSDTYWRPLHHDLLAKDWIVE